LGAGLDFETKIFVKTDAPRLLRAELARKRWRPTYIAISGVTDCYQPVERRLQLTRKCLEVLADFRNPCGVITKNHLVTRDIDVLRELAKYNATSVMVSITTLDNQLAASMEPRTSAPSRRLEAIRQLSDAGIPVGVMVAPVIPGLNDHEIPSILSSAADAGAKYAGYVMLRLPWAVAPLFEQWLHRVYPQRAAKVLGRIRSVRAGEINDPNFHSRMRGEGPIAEQIHAIMQMSKRRCGLDKPMPPLSVESFRVPANEPMLF
jgi:DNA repair photolyase